MDNEEGGYSRDDIFEQLRKIKEEEDKLYPPAGKQISLDFFSKDTAEDAPTESGVGNSRELIESQPDVDFEALADESENPVESKRLWHGTQALIISGIKKGKTRQFALDEKNLFLKASANTTDGKFTFLRANKEAYEIAEKFIRSSEDPVELSMAYWDLNERNGFHSKKKQGSFNANLKAILNVPPPQKGKK
jgi:hypothetical protein